MKSLPVRKMVYCDKCGTKNEEDAVYCVKCGVRLERSKNESWDKRVEKWGEEFGKRAEEWGENFGRQTERGCFGLPHGGLVFGLLIGVIIIVVGLFSLLSGFEPLRFFWPLLLVVFGLMIAAGALYSLTRKH
jgi:ribosomal protein L40E